MKTALHRFVVALLLTATSLAAVLWSWNALGTLFEWPVAEGRHVLAAFVLFSALRWGFTHRTFHHDG